MLDQILRGRPARRRSRKINRLCIPIEALEARRLLTAIVSGERVLGSIAAPADTVEYTFTASVGDSMVLSLGELTTNWAPRLTLLAPDMSQVGIVSGSLSFTDANLQVELLDATQPGTYTAVVGSTGGSAGAFALSLAKLPGPQPFDDGPIVSGQRRTATLERGDLDIYTFSATAGDSVLLSMGELNSNWAPRLDVFAPNGTRVGTVSGSVSFTDANLQIELLNLADSGTYYAVARAASNVVAGDYALTMARMPAAQPFDEGPLASGQRQQTTLDRGDLDVFSFFANTGDSVIVSIGELANWAPRLDVYAPGGTRVGTISGSASFTDANLQLDLLNVTETGTYYAVARSAATTQAGDYGITMARLPGPQPGDLGPVVSGERRLGQIGRGDLDVYTISASAGDSLIVSIGEIVNWAPRVDLYSPTGMQLATNSGSASFTEANLQIEALNVTLGGTYYVVARSAASGQSGPYALTVARLGAAQPFDQGPLASGARVFNSVLRGDLKMHTFSADAGDSVLLSIGEVENWAPRMDVFAPDGTRLDTASGSASFTDANLQSELLTLTQGGTYAVVARSASNGAAGDYALSFARFPATQVPDVTDNDGGPLAVGQTTTGAIATGDLDVYTLPLTEGDAVQVQMQRLTSSFNARLDLFAPSGVRLAFHSGGALATVNLASAPDTGTYFIVARTTSTGAVGNYSIGVNVTPGPDTRPPEVTNAEFRWDVPRQQVVFRMNESVAGSVQVSDLTLMNLTTGQAVPNANKSVAFNTLSNEIVFEFPSYPFRALPDGDYRATLNAGSVEDTAGNALPADHSFDFFFVNGDANRDRAVNLADFNRLAGNFGRQGATFSQGDFNYDGVVNLADFNILAAKFGFTLAPSAGSTTGAPASPFGSSAITVASEDRLDELR